MDVTEPSTSEEVGWESGLSIADQVKAAAEEAVNQSGFVYNEETGLYYDNTTQLYYNSETGLYYNGFTGTWYRYDETICEYVVHHQVEGFTFENAVAEHVLNSIDNYTTELSKKVEAEIKSSKQEGELSEEEVDEVDLKHNKTKGEAHKLAERLPPCARFLVVSSSIDRVKIGSLFVVPYTGGTIGRLPECEVFLDDVNVSKKHAKFGYNQDEKSFTIIDLGSRNGTFIHMERLSGSKETSEEYILAHDSQIQVGSITLLCHIHAGLETCDGCEPGLVIKEQENKDMGCSISANKEDLEKARKRELKKIRQKFGLKLHDSDDPVSLKPGYQDRAEVRRQTVGIDPVGAKTEQASTLVPIAKKNKGFQMLAKMGWNEGQALGKTESADAIIEPISVDMRAGREGLGADAIPSISSFHSDASRKRRADVLEKTRHRYSQAQ
ncbi:angiogenic factor with G patch and FHA domains 1-like [Daphnia carinata]|uniref:angiogenic factor with G patch and FHA domains 1-like n=1 Tax=Daphnia carinata TaxID=120202 RepID=UPI00257F4A64|nr:angiogenic factor with G patch and FHA domains 1-like [Daphnia carinata]